VGQPLEGILGIWRNLWEDGHDLATHALMYTRAQLKAAQEAQRQAERSKLG
jgi:D-psicose/D-tagatose/L-ribulose 3-epimerase